jgi:hypothetical protein
MLAGLLGGPLSLARADLGFCGALVATWLRRGIRQGAPAVDDLFTDVPVLFTPNGPLGGDEEGGFGSDCRCHITDCGFDVEGESVDLMGFFGDVRTGDVSLFFGIFR